jgi:hypothetical protein
LDSTEASVPSFVWVSLVTTKRSRPTPQQLADAACGVEVVERSLGDT